MSKISAIGKYLDQPLLTAKINKNIPLALTVGSSVVLTKEVKNAQEEQKKKVGVKTVIILALTGFSAIKAPQVATFFTSRSNSKTVKEIQNTNVKIVDEFLQTNKVNENFEKLLNKAKHKILSLKETYELFSSKENKVIANKLIPPPENIQAKDIFKEIGWLSIYGAVPVVGGILGGIVADKLVENNWKDDVPNKIKEGIYQYLANIFMCNIGAGIALGILEKLNIKSKSARCIGMISGILLTGVIGGSAIANFISNKIINPRITNNKGDDTRTPELIDLGLHTDDIATVSLLSGLKWIEPSLPLLYSISGYRAGTGYRNSNEHSSGVNKNVKKICNLN